LTFSSIHPDSSRRRLGPGPLFCPFAPRVSKTGGSRRVSGKLMVPACRGHFSKTYTTCRGAPNACGGGGGDGFLFLCFLLKSWELGSGVVLRAPLGQPVHTGGEDPCVHPPTGRSPRNARVGGDTSLWQNPLFCGPSNHALPHTPPPPPRSPRTCRCLRRNP
jgi:hypothetical protein